MTAYTLTRHYDEAGGVRTFVFSSNGATWQAGQYQTYELQQAGSDKKEYRRWFTIASAPSEGEIHISTRVTDSAFKQALNALQPGDTIEAHDIEGDFTWEDDAPVVLVAGGIGVTPYRSILIERAALGRPLNATLLYFGRTDQFAFREEFDKLTASHPELKIEYIVGEHVSVEAIMARAPKAKQQPVYISGPEAMVDTVGDELKAQGITIKQDWFPGYTEQTY